MESNPFTPKLQDLPDNIPVFPLPGATIMPGTQLPLNVFEPRYLNMVSDALAAGRMFGMIQPQPDAVDTDAPNLCRTGCAGRITSFSETSDGRFFLILTGVCRFDALQELPPTRGYRRVVPDWRPYAVDCETVGTVIDRTPLLDALQAFCSAQHVKVSWDEVTDMSDTDLVNLFAAQLPFSVAEKQALIEAVTAAERADMLRSLLRMSGPESADMAHTRH